MTYNPRIKNLENQIIQLSGSAVTGTVAQFTALSASFISASQLIVDGNSINNLTASNITNFTADVRAQFVAGTGIAINAGGISASNVPNSSLQNSSVTIGSTAISLGASAATLAGLTSITASTALFQGDVTINGTASIAQINTLNQQSLVVGDKYITILSGATDHPTLDGSGMLWGSGSTGPTVNELGSNAHLRYRNSFDKLEVFPGLYVSGALTSSAGVSGTVAQFTSVTASHAGSGAGLTGIPNAALVNSAVTVGSTAISLGGSATTIQGITVLTGSTVTGSTALFTNIAATSVGVGTTAPNHTLSVTGTLGVSSTVTFGTALGVASGGTGTNTLTANNIILGNGTSAVSFVAPGTNGNVLTSNGTTWVSQAPSGGSVSKYSAAIGNGSATSIVVTHSLNTANIIVSVRENTTNGYFVYPDIQYTSVNSITLTFATAPTSNQYLVNVLGL